MDLSTCGMSSEIFGGYLVQEIEGFRSDVPLEALDKARRELMRSGDM